MLAGKFKRIAAQKQKAKVRHGADEVSDVELGSNLSRVLPSELVKLSHPLLRRAFLASLVEGKVMQYRLSGHRLAGARAARGVPRQVGGMDGAKDIWATAVALALLDVAQRQRRPFALVAFDGDVKRQDIVEVGGQLPEETLFTSCSGGTNITGVLSRALSIIQTSTGGMKAADVVLVTDGESETQDAPVVRQFAEQLRVTILGVGIGVSAESLKPWCDDGSKSCNDEGQSTTSYPPDCNGTVGPKHFFQTINSSYTIYDKATGCHSKKWDLSAIFFQLH